MTVGSPHNEQHLPSLSIAMCTFNGARYLSYQLDTIANQTIAPTELVICDDQSTDDTMALLAAFADRAPFPVHIRVNATRLGSAQNFAGCMACCVGDIIVLTDQDDVWMPDRLERTREAFAIDPYLSFTFSDAELMDGNNATLGRMIFDSVPILARDRGRLTAGDDLLPLILRYGVIYGATMAVRRADAIRVLPVPALWSHDEWLSLTLSAIGHSARMAPVIRYRQHSAQVVGAGNARLATTLTSARNRHADYYTSEAKRQQSGLLGAAANPSLAATLAPLLEEKLRFIQTRRLLQRSGPVALRGILKQVRRGSYARYASGVRSALKDMALIAIAGFDRG